MKKYLLVNVPCIILDVLIYLNISWIIGLLVLVMINIVFLLSRNIINNSSFNGLLFFSLILIHGVIVRHLSFITIIICLSVEFDLISITLLVTCIIYSFLNGRN